MSVGIVVSACDVDAMLDSQLESFFVRLFFLFRPPLV